MSKPKYQKLNWKCQRIIIGQYGLKAHTFLYLNCLQIAGEKKWAQQFTTFTFKQKEKLENI